MHAGIPLWLQIYLLGYLIAFIECILIFRDDRGMINWVELVVAILMSVLSWVLALALWVGMNIKNAEDRKKDNDNLAGT